MKRRVYFVALGLSLLLMAAPKFVEAQVLRVFTGPNGSSPSGSLVRDAGGALYGNTRFGGSVRGYDNGLVYKLTPPLAGSHTWAEQILHQFPATSSDGYNPQGGLLADPLGALYGATYSGGSSGYGIIFRLSPPAGGSGLWTETILQSVDSKDGHPEGDLIEDASGALYGLAAGDGIDNFGTVFKLAPPLVKDGPWIFQTLHTFDTANDAHTPEGKLAMDAAGNLYGATYSGDGSARYGTVFQLSPPAAGQVTWTETIL